MYLTWKKVLPLSIIICFFWHPSCFLNFRAMLRFLKIDSRVFSKNPESNVGSSCLKSTTSTYFRPRSAECDGNSEKCQNTHKCGWMVQDKSLQLIYLNKWKHPMLVISRLQSGNSESKWVGGVILNPRWSTFSCLQDTGACFIIFFLYH